ncbi:hypothetical protein Bbelb_335950 [Branchiostoma belcheri]|nr:hypothetical protein Bbelb_335950 [Branchiostoma belcheri]
MEARPDAAQLKGRQGAGRSSAENGDRVIIGVTRAHAVIFPTNLCLESTDRSRQAAAGHTLIRSRYSCGQGPGSEPAQCAWEQTVHVKPPPDTPSSPETTNVCIPSPETSIPGPGRAVRPVTPPETDVTAVPGTADATKPM